jgi:hypothetical protein
MSIVHRSAVRSASPPTEAVDRPLRGARARPRRSHAGASAGDYADAVEEPLLYTVLEAAKQLHIGRTLAYQQAERYLATNGRDGIPAIKIGNCLRVPRPGLLALAFTGRIASPSELESYVHGLLRQSNRPRQIVVRRGRRIRSSAAADGRRPSSTGRSPSRARRTRTGRRTDSAEQLKLLPTE